MFSNFDCFDEFEQIYLKKKLKDLNCNLVKENFTKIKELFKGEKEIKEQINNSNNIKNGFKEYGLLNSECLKNI